MGMTPLPGGHGVIGTDGSPLYHDSLVNVSWRHKKELMALTFPPGTYLWVSLGRLSVNLEVAPDTSRVYISLDIGFMRTDAWCMCCSAHITLHCPPQDREDQEDFRCPPQLSSETNLAILRERMATWLEKRVGEGYFLRVRYDPAWDGRNHNRRRTYEVLEIEPRNDGLYSHFALFLGMAKNSLQLITPPYYRPTLHIRIQNVELVGRAPSAHCHDGFWNSGAGRSEREAVPGRNSRSWSCP